MLRRGRFAYSLGVSFGVALISGALLTGLALGTGDSGGQVQPAPYGSCADFAIEGSRDALHETVYDPQAKLLTVFQNGKGYVLDIESSTCKALSVYIQQLIDAQVNDHKQHMTGECASWKGFLASGQTSLRGQAVNKSDVQTYINESCAGL